MVQTWMGLARLGQHVDALVPFFHRPLHLGHRHLDVTQVGNDSQRNKAIAHFAPLADGVVIGPHAVELKGSVPALEHRPGLYRIVGEQHFGIHAILI